MAVKHVNRKGQTFYLHETRTKTGKPKYFFSMKEDGVLVESIPEGHEVYENPDAQVFLRKKLPRFITDEESAVVREGLRKHAKGRHCMADVRERHIVVSHSERGDLYQKMLRFTLIDEDRRRFAAERWCFLGSIDDWIHLGGSDDLAPLLDVGAISAPAYPQVRCSGGCFMHSPNNTSNSRLTCSASPLSSCKNLRPSSSSLPSA